VAHHREQVRLGPVFRLCLLLPLMHQLGLGQGSRVFGFGLLFLDAGKPRLLYPASGDEKSRNQNDQRTADRHDGDPLRHNVPVL
jgi:hypothetical protein